MLCFLIRFLAHVSVYVRCNVDLVVWNIPEVVISYYILSRNTLNTQAQQHRGTNREKEKHRNLVLNLNHLHLPCSSNRSHNSHHVQQSNPTAPLTPYTYLYISAGTTAIIWAITCLVAFNNPVELYVNKREQTDAKLQDRDILLDRMCETVESDHQVLTRLTDSIRRMQKGMNDEEISPAVPSFPKETVTLKSKPFPTKGFPSKFAAQSAKTTKPQKAGLVHAKQKITSRKNGNQKAIISASGANMPMS
jgi:hypothetical protein